MDPNDFSEKLMKLSMDLQGMSQDKQKAFAQLFYAAKQALDKGYTQEEIQIIVVTALQIGQIQTKAAVFYIDRADRY